VAEVNAGVTATVQCLPTDLSAEMLIWEAWTALDITPVSLTRQLKAAVTGADEAVLLSAGVGTPLLPTSA
jgi:Flp pilus assembly protein CpaB